MASNLKRRAYRNRRRRGNRRIAVFALVGCVIIGAGAFCISLAYTSLTSPNRTNVSPPGNTAIQSAGVETAPAASSTPNAFATISLTGKAAIVYDLTTGQTLYAQNADAPLPLASITKLLTIYAASNALKSNSIVTITPTALALKGSAADNGFRSKETFNFEEIACLTLTASSNVGAEAIVEASASAENTETTSLLAAAAQRAGLTQTQAESASGLDKSETTAGSYGSAHDMAVLAGELLKKEPRIAAATTRLSTSITSHQGRRHKFANTDTYFTKRPRLLLSKTGYTDIAGGNLVIVVDAGVNHPVAIVVLGSTKRDRFTDVAKLRTASFTYFGIREQSHNRSRGRATSPPRRNTRHHQSHQRPGAP